MESVLTTLKTVMPSEIISPKIQTLPQNRQNVILAHQSYLAVSKDSATISKAWYLSWGFYIDWCLVLIVSSFLWLSL